IEARLPRLRKALPPPEPLELPPPPLPPPPPAPPLPPPPPDEELALELAAELDEPPPPALTLSPTWLLSASTVPLMGAVRVASLRFCWAVWMAVRSLASLACSVTLSLLSDSWSLVIVFWC